MSQRRTKKAEDFIIVTFRNGTGQRKIREVITGLDCKISKQLTSTGAVITLIPEGKTAEELVSAFQKLSHVKSAITHDASYAS